ncbi:hypothetical protein [Salipiger mucosus]|uniref:Lipoprotein n=1 Tax=Salipiger mucosus DSM 16094 TaxID=1123237 RepID=S9R4J3_9RHOB|nr:hypothetical protein [Salipiger mucosus]EPX86847.1 hypothetical protein Salmuc_01497 [Salipiger mucosus DSM 16094]
MIRLVLTLSLVLGLAACADGQRELKEPVEPLGDFQLGFAEVVAPNLLKGPVSREATKEEWSASVDEALEERFGRYEGGKYYHLGVSVEGYVLAQPGIPLVFSPKSALIVRATVWDDAAQSKLNPEPEQITVLEAISPETMMGSGLTQSKEVQMRNLSANVALQIEKWMRRMQRTEGWFGGEASAAAADEAPASGPEVASVAE